MVKLRGEYIYLRALEPEDLELVHDIENNTSFWDISDTITPFSKFVIRQYLENSHKDIFEVKQLRLVICTKAKEAIGLIDLFDFDFKNRRAGVGIIIKDSKNRSKGYGAEALTLLTEYCFTTLQLHQLFAHIDAMNTKSLTLFKNQGFNQVGIKEDWRFDGNKYFDVCLLQKIKAVN